MAKIKTRIIMEELRSGEVLYFLEQRCNLLTNFWKTFNKGFNSCEDISIIAILIIGLFGLVLTPILFVYPVWNRIHLEETNFAACKLKQDQILSEFKKQEELVKGDQKDVKRKLVVKGSIKKSC